MWKFLSRPTSRHSAETDVSGVSILLLQKRFRTFTTEQLLHAMQTGWRRAYDPVTFFATSVGDDEAAVIKFNAMLVTIQYFDRLLDTSVLGERELPQWAIHRAYSSITYACPGGIPAGDTREQFYGFLGLLCAELIDKNIVGLLFAEEQVLVRGEGSIIQALRSGNSISPARFAATQCLGAEERGWRSH